MNFKQTKEEIPDTMKFKFIFLLLFTSWFASFGQSSIDDTYNVERNEYIIGALTKKKNLTLDELTELTRAHSRIGEYSNGLLYSEELMRRCIEAKDTTRIVEAINVKTENLVDLKRYEDGLAFCESHLSYFREQDSADYQLLCFKLGVIYFQLEMYEEGYKAYNEITMPKFREGDVFYTNYAVMLMGLEMFDEAIIYLKKSINYNREDGYGSCANFGNIGLILMMQKKWDEAKVYIDSSYWELQKQPSIYDQKVVFRNYYDLYLHTDKIELAGDYLDSISMTNEAIFNKQLNEELLALETSFEREHSLKKEIVSVDNELAYTKKATLYGIIIALISLLVLVSIIGFLWIRNIKAQNQNILIEQKLLRSQMTPHFMFNSLAILQGIILNKEYTKSIGYLSKFSKLLRITLENSRDKLVPLKNEMEAIENYILVQNLGTDHPFQCTITIHETINQERLMIPPMMIQPFIENSIEHGFPVQKEDQEVAVSIYFQGKDLICEIIDNGVGLEQSKVKRNDKKNSLATTITTERLAMLAKEFKVKTSLSIVDRKTMNESGTIVTLRLPYKLL